MSSSWTSLVKRTLQAFFQARFPPQISKNMYAHITTTTNTYTNADFLNGKWYCTHTLKINIYIYIYMSPELHSSSLSHTHTLSSPSCRTYCTSSHTSPIPTHDNIKDTAITPLELSVPHSLTQSHTAHVKSSQTLETLYGVQCTIVPYIHFTIICHHIRDFIPHIYSIFSSLFFLSFFQNKNLITRLYETIMTAHKMTTKLSADPPRLTRVSISDTFLPPHPSRVADRAGLPIPHWDWLAPVAFHFHVIHVRSQDRGRAHDVQSFPEILLGEKDETKGIV